MIQNKRLGLLNAWKYDMFSEFSISEIMKIAKKRTKPWVFNALNMLVKNKLVIAKRKGNMNLYSLNYLNPLLIQTIQYLEAQDSMNFIKLDIIADIIDKLPVVNYCLLVFGSYADNKHAKDSDLDVCFLIDSKDVEKKIKPYVEEIKLNYPVKIDDHYVTFSDFIEMLLRKEENLGKQIFRKHKLFFNADIYYTLIKEAYKNGFRQ